MLALRFRLETFLTNAEATHWLHVCHPQMIEAAISRHGPNKLAYTVGKAGAFGLKAEIKERRVQIPSAPKSRRKTNTKKLRALMEDYL